MTEHPSDFRAFAGQMQPIAVESLRIAPENPRDHEADEDHQIEELAESIMLSGLLTPLIAYLEPGESTVAQVVAGGRRTRAMRLLAERGDWGWDVAVPVRVIDQSDAADAGFVEQIAHRKLSDREELRIMQLERFKFAEDAHIARILGRTTAWVKKRRAILDLPEFAIDALNAGTIGIEQAAGLTYFLGDEETIAEMIEGIEHGHNITREDMKRHFERQCTEWDRHPMTKFVSEEAYIAAGGNLQQDLLSPERFITDPETLHHLAREAVRELRRKEGEEAGWGAFVEIPPDQYTDFRRHPGLSTLSDEEKEELAALEAKPWSDKESADYDRQRELANRNRGHYPPELKALLGFGWRFSPRNADGGITFEGVLPADLEPLYEAGFLDRPAPEEDGDIAEEAPEPVDPADKPVSGKLLQDINLIKLHTWRMEAIKKPDTILEAFYDNMRSRFGMDFDMIQRDGDVPPDTLPLTASEKWEEAGNLVGVPDLKPAQMRTALAYLMARRARLSLAPEVTGKQVRAYFTPDAVFLKRYTKAQLGKMHAELEPERSHDGSHLKRDALAELVADLGTVKPDWLPTGF